MNAALENRNGTGEDNYKVIKKAFSEMENDPDTSAQVSQIFLRCDEKSGERDKVIENIFQFGIQFFLYLA